MIHGILLVDKPEKITSHDVVAKMRRFFHQKKVGHGGTLDPMATGLLVVLLGAATRLSDHFIKDDKFYEGRCIWGAKTDTADRTGSTIDESDAPLPSDRAIRDAMGKFLGEISQVPPMFSAKKIDGKKLYKLARKGKEVSRKPVRVTIHQFDLTSIDSTGFSFEVRCSKGTYIRTLTEDLCDSLGGLGNLGALRRTSTGGYDLSCAWSLYQIHEAVDLEKTEPLIVPLESACARFASVHLDAADAQKMIYGILPPPVRYQTFDDFKADETLRILGPSGDLLALVRSKVASSELLNHESPVKPLKIEVNFSANPL
jgi:tRNA pseudouridine55 synthase